MNNMKKIWTFLAVLALLVAMCAMLGGCGGTQSGETTAPAAQAGTNANYTVTVKTAGGMCMENIGVSVFADETMTDLKGYGQTNASGVATIELPQGGNYFIQLSGQPKGYEMQKYYSFSGNTANIVLKSSLVKGESLGDTRLGLGDVMYDFTVTTPAGEKVTLSEMLETKKMVLLNFWYTTCTWCVTEFPYMEEAYQQYQDDVGIIAVNYTGEPDSDIANFPANYGLSLSFPLASCPTTWANTFSIQGAPTSIIIDRYGVIVMVEAGAITSLRPFACLFETLTADDYEQKIYNSIGDVVTQVTPTYEMADSDTVAEIMGTTGLEITFRPEEGDEGEYSWPFIEAEKNGEKCLKASNQGIDESFAILYVDVNLKAGEALGFDFLRSSETASDVLHVIVNDEPINSISGFFEEEKWESCYPVVAEKDGTYEVAICYMKDESTDVADDTFYIKNMRIVSKEEIDSATYLPRPAAVRNEDDTYTYAELVYNESDGYYHVGSKNGPLLLVDLLGLTAFDGETSVWLMASDGRIVLDGVDYLEKLTPYCNYASNSQLNGICTVNQELYELLQIVDKVEGFSEEDDREWLKLCKYFEAYGTNGQQLEDPIAGLTTFSAYKATLGKNVKTNCFYYNRIIMPRGLYAEFTPTRSGVYRITSRTDSGNRVDGWIFNKDREILMTYEWDERMFTDGNNVSMVYYMEAGKSYYIDIAFWDVYEVGYVYYDIEFLGSSYSHFRSASPGPFTYDSDATGSAMYHTIAGGIDVVLGSDGIYYHDLGNGKKGSPIYVDFTQELRLLSRAMISNGNDMGVIDLGGFDFSKTEDDLYIISFLNKHDGDVEKTTQYLMDYWGESYKEYFAMYQVEDVLNGIYHGDGEDLTDEIKSYMSKIITSGPSERRGCVVVTEELAELLQKLMDKYTFKGVDTSWRKLCYYYDYMG